MAVDRLGILGLYLFFPPMVSVAVALVFAFAHYISTEPQDNTHERERRTEMIMKDKYEDIFSRLKIGGAIGLGIGLFIAYRCHVGERRRGARDDRENP